MTIKAGLAVKKKGQEQWNNTYFPGDYDHDLRKFILLLLL